MGFDIVGAFVFFRFASVVVVTDLEHHLRCGSNAQSFLLVEKKKNRASLNQSTGPKSGRGL